MAWPGRVTIQICIVAGGGLLACDTVQPGLRYGTQRPTTRHRSAGTRTADAQHGRGACDTALSSAHDNMARGAQSSTRSCVSCVTAGARPATQRSAHAVCAQAGPGCAPGALHSVLTQCIVLSHYLGHCL